MKVSYGILISIVFGMIFCSSSFATESLTICPQLAPVDSEHFYSYEAYCDYHGFLVKVIRKFPEGQLSAKFSYKNGKLTSEDVYSIDGQHVSAVSYQYDSDDSYYRIKSSTNPSSFGTIISKEKYLSKNQEDFLIEKWIWEERRGPRYLIQIDYYNPGDRQVIKRTQFDQNGKNLGTAHYEYADRPAIAGQLAGFSVVNENNRVVRSFKEDLISDPLSLMDAQNISYLEKNRRKNIYRQKRRPIIIFDSGFDINHLNLTYKLYDNPLEEIDGIDNDGNGWIDDEYGWFRDERLGKDSGNINERLLFTEYELPLSHGTHVADIALHDIESFALVGMGGDCTDPVFLKGIRNFIELHSVSFVNMSFGFPGPRHPMAPSVESFDELDHLIGMSTETLFVIASGNQAVNIDHGKSQFYPAALKYSNTLVVGASDSPNSNIFTMLDSLQMDFSNYGQESVDILAPGHDVPGALIGGGEIVRSGTSMASPYAMNIALKVAEVNPLLTVYQIKELLMKSAYIPDIDNPLKVVSGGIIYPDRALAVALELIVYPEKTVEEAVIDVRRNNNWIDSINNMESYISKLRVFWNSWDK